MSWKIGKSKPKQPANGLSIQDMAMDARSTTPTPGNPSGKPQSGLLAIRILWAENLALPSGAALPPVVQAALSFQQAKVAASVSPSSVTQQVR